mmetsp:Transcript_65399/g.151739  ORF Transcript_65399/g.151739 Transcript_65399/m.151739 type:complete len:504 (+) Transcript_65399:1-1512(+)
MPQESLVPKESSVLQESLVPHESSGISTLAPESSRPKISVRLSLENLNILRATSIKCVLGQGALMLQDSSGTEDTYLQSQATHEIDVFISHNWVVPRRKKFWALALYFNVVYATAASYIGVALGCCLNVLQVPPTLQNVDRVMRPYCLILGSCSFFLALMMGHDIPFMGKLFCRQKLFLDKVCINQIDPHLKAAGIKSLGAFLSHSNKMLVLFHSAYVQRLWTVYEMACFMYLHRREKLELLPVDIARVVLQSTVAIMITQGMIMAVVHFGSVLGIGIMVRTLSAASIGSFATLVIAFILRGWALQQSELFSSLRSFQIDKARCTDESDRLLVSANICSFVRAMGLAQDEASDTEVLRSFDKLVQQNMPESLRSAIGRTGLPYKYAFLAGTAFEFYNLDYVSSQPDLTASFTLAYLVYGFNLQAAIIPSVFLICGWAGNKCPPLGRWAELALRVGTATLALAVMLSAWLLSTFLRERAAVNAWWLLPYVACCAVQTFVVARLF